MSDHRPLNERQLSVLRWVANGSPEDVMSRSAVATKVTALQHRRLVTIRRVSGSWSATCTERGQYYLEHGEYPEAHDEAAPATRSRTHPPAKPTPQSSVPVARVVNRAPSTRTSSNASEELIRHLIEVEPQLTFSRDEEKRYRAIVAAAKRTNRVPDAFRIRIDMRGGDGCVVMERRPESIAVPETLRTVSDVVRQLIDQDILRIRKNERQRALHLL
jgi:hypothetical protein